MRMAAVQAMSQARFTLTGTARELPEEEQEAAKQLFLKRNPNSFWVNFGDFSWWRLDDLVAVRFNLGFAQAGQVCPSSAKGTQLSRWMGAKALFRLLLMAPCTA